MSESVCNEAHRIVTEARCEEYGEPILNLTRIAIMWSLRLGVNVMPQDVAACMQCVKFARQIHKNQCDNIVDGCGYLQTEQEVLDFYERHQTTPRDNPWELLNCLTGKDSNAKAIK